MLEWILLRAPKAGCRLCFWSSAKSLSLPPVTLSAGCALRGPAHVVCAAPYNPFHNGHRDGKDASPVLSPSSQATAWSLLREAYLLD